MPGYTNGDGKYHEHDRRENWYSNKDLYEKMVSMTDRFTSMEKTIIRFENKFEKYNGLHDRLVDVETRPCRQDSEIKEMSRVIRTLAEDMTYRNKVDEARYKTVALVGTLIGIVGGVLGIMALLGVL